MLSLVRNTLRSVARMGKARRFVDPWWQRHSRHCVELLSNSLAAWPVLQIHGTRLSFQGNHCGGSVSSQGQWGPPFGSLVAPANGNVPGGNRPGCQRCEFVLLRIATCSGEDHMATCDRSAMVTRHVVPSHVSLADTCMQSEKSLARQSDAR